MSAGRAGRQGFWGLACPADGGTDALGARPPAIPAVGVKRSGFHPAEKKAATGRSARRVSRLDGENGGFGPIRPDPVRNRISTLRRPSCR